LSNVDQSSLHDDLVEKFEVMTLENKKLKKYLTNATIKGEITIESNHFNNELVLDNERLREGIKKLKLEKEQQQIKTRPSLFSTNVALSPAAPKKQKWLLARLPTCGKHRLTWVKLI
jgi:regulator of replication initiation timing